MVEVYISVLCVARQQGYNMQSQHTLFISDALGERDFYKMGSHPRAFCTINSPCQVTYLLLKQS